MFKSIDNIGIAVSNLDVSLSFYETIGFKKTWGADRGCIVEQGTIKLFLFETQDPKPKPLNRNILDLLENPVGFDHISFNVDDVDATYEALKTKGIQFERAPSDEDWGARVVGFKDPDGNPLYFLKWLENKN